MLLALVERGIHADLVVGCSIGAINGAAFSADPTLDGLDRLRRFWERDAGDLVDRGSLRDRARSYVGRRPYLFDTSRLRDAVTQVVPATFADLCVPFQCVAASIERATEHWFDDGPLIDAVVASASIPGLFPAARVGDEHFYDGGLVDSIPLDRALELGADEVYVLQVGRIEQPLEPPQRLHQALLVAFEIARRHRFATQRAAVGDAVVHVVPSGHRLAMDDRRQLAWRRTDDAGRLIDQARRATGDYLDRIAA
jgi:NTE family protein